MLKKIHELRLKKDKSALEEDQKDIDQALEESK
uniref:Uncharacterized protein n=1 Tax=Romanomermis culicivorax TaxID=13658 RepID=A0A915L5K3_ROMCU